MSQYTAYLPLISYVEYQVELLAEGNDAAIPAQPVTEPGQVFYTTTLQVPADLPTGGTFYFSSSPDAVSPVYVDDELVVVLNGAEIFNAVLTGPRIVEVPRSVMEELAGQSATLIFRDVGGAVSGASEVYLIWESY